MIERSESTTKGLAYLVLYISYIISIMLLPKISIFLAPRVRGAVLFLLTYGVAFGLMIFVFPKLVGYLMNR